MNRTPKKSQGTKLTLKTKIPPPRTRNLAYIISWRGSGGSQLVVRKDALADCSGLTRILHGASTVVHDQAFRKRRGRKRRERGEKERADTHSIRAPARSRAPDSFNQNNSSGTVYCQDSVFCHPPPPPFFNFFFMRTYTTTLHGGWNRKSFL